MSRLPALTATKIIRALKKVGFVEDRKKGGHLVLIKLSTNIRTVIPIHAGKTIRRFLVRAIINDAKLSIDEFRDLL